MLPERLSNQHLSLFDRFFANNLFDWSSNNYSITNTTMPSANIKESTDDFEVEVAAPGLTRNDFDIELVNDILTVSSVKEDVGESEEGNKFMLREYSYQSFSRSFTLPNSADSDKIGAKYENGILRITIPKKEEAKPIPARQITIS